MVAMITLRQLADEINHEDARMQMTPKKLRRYCKQGMRYYDDGNRWLVRREWYDEFFSARAGEACAERAGS